MAEEFSQMSLSNQTRTARALWSLLDNASICFMREIARIIAATSSVNSPKQRPWSVGESVSPEVASESQKPLQSRRRANHETHRPQEADASAKYRGTDPAQPVTEPVG